MDCTTEVCRQQHWDVSWAYKRPGQLCIKSSSGKSSAAPALGWARHVIRVARRCKRRNAKNAKNAIPYLILFHPPLLAGANKGGNQKGKYEHFAFLALFAPRRRARGGSSLRDDRQSEYRPRLPTCPS
jgi:hypothetical protein